MKRKLLIAALMLGGAFAAWADGYNDGIEYYKAGQYNNARTVLTRTLNEAGTNKALSYYYLGSIDLVDGNLAAAKANFDKGISADAENPYNYVGLGAIDLRNGNVKAAEEQFKMAQKLGKKNHEITVDIARSYYNADPVKYAPQVDKYLEKAHKDSKNTEPAIYILEGDRLFDQKDLGSAAAKYEQAITFDQDNPEGYVKYAKSYMGVNPAYGIAKLEELLQKQPTSALAQRELAERYYEVNQWSKAADQYGKYMSNPNHFPEDKTRYLVLIYASGEYPHAIQIADEILSGKDFNNTQKAQALRVKMLSQNETKDYEGAKATAEQFLNMPLDPGAESHFNQNDYATYGMILDALGDKEGAIAQFETALTLDPSKLDNYKRISSAYTDLKDFQKAAEAYQCLVDSGSDDVTLTDYLTLSGRWLNAANNAGEDAAQAAADAEKGIEAINKVIEGASTVEPSYLQRKALLTYFADNKEATERVGQVYLDLVNLLDSNPDNAVNQKAAYKQAYQMLYLYYNNKGDKDAADQMYEKFSTME